VRQEFTPALGRESLTGAYDRAIRLLTREWRWRSLLLDQVAPTAGESIIDVGCGTGTLAILLKRRAPGARIVGLDPDSRVLAIARAKAAHAGVELEWREGFARDAGRFGSDFDKAVSSLVFHQVPVEEKEAGIAAMLAALRPGGELHIADYAHQESFLMRQLFRIVQQLDGHANTQANADGALERIFSEQAGHNWRRTEVVRTPTGAISLFAGTVADPPGVAAPIEN